MTFVSLCVCARESFIKCVNASTVIPLVPLFIYTKFNFEMHFELKVHFIEQKIFNWIYCWFPSTLYGNGNDDDDDDDSVNSSNNPGDGRHCRYIVMATVASRKKRSASICIKINARGLLTFVKIKKQSVYYDVDVCMENERFFYCYFGEQQSDVRVCNARTASFCMRARKKMNENIKRKCWIKQKSCSPSTPFSAGVTQCDATLCIMQSKDAERASQM